MLTNSSSFNYFYFYGSGAPGGVTQTLAGKGTYSSSVWLRLFNDDGLIVSPGSSLTFNGASNQDNFEIDSGSVLTVTNPLTVTAPTGANFVQLLNGGSVAGNGGIRTRGSVYLYGAAGGLAWAAPVEVISGTAQGNGSFAGPFRIDAGASLVGAGELSFFDNLTVPNGASFDLNGQPVNFQGDGKTFSNNGILANSGSYNTFFFYGNGTPGGVTQTFSGNGAYSSTVKLQVYNYVGVNVAPATSLTFGPASNNINLQIDTNSVLTLTSPLTLTAPSGANFIEVFNGGAVAGSGGLKTHGNVYLASYSGALEWSAPVEILPGAAQGYGSFAGPCLMDTGTAFTLDSTLLLYDNLTIASGATLSGGAGIMLNFNGASFSNDGTVSVPAVQFGGAAQALTGTGNFSAGSTLNILNGSTTTLNSDHQLGKLDVNSGGSFDITNRTLKLSGAGTPLTVNGTLPLTGSTVEYDGSSAQALPANVLTYNNLTLNNPTGVTGISGLTVQGLLRVMAGTFTSSSTYNNVQIDSGATPAGTNGTTINVGGNWSNSGAFSANGSTVNFDGAGAQTIGGGAATAFDSSRSTTAARA